MAVRALQRASRRRPSRRDAAAGRGPHGIDTEPRPLSRRAPAEVTRETKGVRSRRPRCRRICRLRATLTYTYGPDEVVHRGRPVHHREVRTSTFSGTTAYGERSRLPFHVVSGDWQESDQVLVGIIKDFGGSAHAVEFGGRGEFDGVMTGAFRSPRVEGTFAGDDLRAFDTLWGSRLGADCRREQLCERHRRRRAPRRLGNPHRRPVLARVSSRRRRRRDQRADPRLAPRRRQPASRVRHRRLSRVGPAVRRVPFDRRVPAPARIRQP